MTDPLYGVTDAQFAAMVRHVRGKRDWSHPLHGSYHADLLARIYELIMSTEDPTDAETLADDIATAARRVADDVDARFMAQEAAE
jgi:molybdopterin-guanine dinucleotide biosynthesis protein A